MWVLISTEEEMSNASMGHVFTATDYDLKGIVHPKMKILSSFTHPQVVPDLYECVCSAEHKGTYSEEWGKQSSSGAPLTSIVERKILWKSTVPQNSLVTNFLQNIFLCDQQNKDIHTGLELLEGEKIMTIFIFGRTIPLRRFLYYMSKKEIQSGDKNTLQIHTNGRLWLDADFATMSRGYCGYCDGWLCSRKSSQVSVLSH